MSSPSSDRRGVVGLLVLLFAITYLDRVCISVAGPRMQADLGIDAIGWGWVTGIFTFAYCVFEIPTGTMGDRLGPRRVLTRIVAWWSVFTILTGTVTGFLPLLLIRFLFGAGEAGAFPNASIVVARWFPPGQRATMSGVNLMASQIGGAIAPLLVRADPDALRLADVVLRVRRRRSGLGGGLVCVVPRLARGEAGTRAPRRLPRPPRRARLATASRGARPPGRRPCWAVLGLAFCYIYVYNFFQTWFHTFLVRGRGFSEARPGAVGAAVRGGRVREPRRRRGQRRAGAAARHEARPPIHRRHGPGHRRRCSPSPPCSPSIRCSPWSSWR